MQDLCELVTVEAPPVTDYLIILLNQLSEASFLVRKQRPVPLLHLLTVDISPHKRICDLQGLLLSISGGYGCAPKQPLRYQHSEICATHQKYVQLPQLE